MGFIVLVVLLGQEGGLRRVPVGDVAASVRWIGPCGLEAVSTVPHLFEDFGVVGDEL